MGGHDTTSTRTSLRCCGDRLRGSIFLNPRKTPELTRIVEHDNLLHNDPGKIQFAGGSNPIKHVIYVIKENRTYDQILGDLKVGDGDPSLTMYGADITPNEHKLASTIWRARQFLR